MFYKEVTSYTIKAAFDLAKPKPVSVYFRRFYAFYYVIFKDLIAY